MSREIGYISRYVIVVGINGGNLTPEGVKPEKTTVTRLVVSGQ